MFQAEIEKSATGLFTLKAKSQVVADIIKAAAGSTSARHWTLHSAKILVPHSEPGGQPSWSSECRVYHTDSVIRLLQASGAATNEGIVAGDRACWCLFAAKGLAEGVTFQLTNPMSLTSLRSFAGHMRDVAQSLIEGARPISVSVRVSKKALVEVASAG